jgi:FkbM family methyltransferase
MRKIFIDLGANKGEATDEFYKQFPTMNFEFHCFEPNTRFKNVLESKNYPTVYHSSAAWILDGEVLFKIDDNEKGYGSTCILTKNTGNFSATAQIPCIDISKWILKNFTEEDFIVLKMDVEGAEYEIIPKLFSDGALALIDIFFLDLHPNGKLKMPGSTFKKYQKKVDSILRNFGQAHGGSLFKNPPVCNTQRGCSALYASIGDLITA